MNKIKMSITVEADSEETVRKLLDELSSNGYEVKYNVDFKETTGVKRSPNSKLIMEEGYFYNPVFHTLDDVKEIINAYIETGSTLGAARKLGIHQKTVHRVVSRNYQKSGYLGKCKGKIRVKTVIHSQQSVD